MSEKCFYGYAILKINKNVLSFSQFPCFYKKQAACAVDKSGYTGAIQINLDNETIIPHFGSQMCFLRIYFTIQTSRCPEKQHHFSVCPVADNVAYLHDNMKAIMAPIVNLV